MPGTPTVRCSRSCLLQRIIPLRREATTHLRVSRSPYRRESVALRFRRTAHPGAGIFAKNSAAAPTARSRTACSSIELLDNVLLSRTSAQMPIEVAGSDVEGVVVTLAPGIRTATLSFAVSRRADTRCFAWEAIEPNAWYDRQHRSRRRKPWRSRASLHRSDAWRCRHSL